jgi:hypothetical protein
MMRRRLVEVVRYGETRRSEYEATQLRSFAETKGDGLSTGLYAVRDREVASSNLAFPTMPAFLGLTRIRMRPSAAPPGGFDTRSDTAPRLAARTGLATVTAACRWVASVTWL